MSDNMAAENLEAIHLGHKDHDFPQTTMRANALSNMNHLKLLVLWGGDFSGSLDYLSNELGYLHWKKYPFEFLPPSFQSDKLVELYMPLNNIKQLWKDTKPLHNLRRLDLSFSKNLIKVPNFGETLNLEGCIQLKQIDPSIGLLKKLTVLNCKDAKI